jgi:DNA-binding MarR family transcriptional regulator
VPDPADKRATFAVITAEGEAALRTTAPIYLAGIERHFTRHLSERQQRCITEGLDRVIEAQEQLDAPRRR